MSSYCHIVKCSILIDVNETNSKMAAWRAPTLLHSNWHKSPSSHRTKKEHMSISLVLQPMHQHSAATSTKQGTDTPSSPVFLLPAQFISASASKNILAKIDWYLSFSCCSSSGLKLHSSSQTSGTESRRIDTTEYTALSGYRGLSVGALLIYISQISLAYI